MALLTFNLGVEAGQLMFVAAAIALYAIGQYAIGQCVLRSNRVTGVCRSGLRDRWNCGILVHSADDGIVPGTRVD